MPPVEFEPTIATGERLHGNIQTLKVYIIIKRMELMYPPPKYKVLRYCKEIGQSNNDPIYL